MTYATVDQTTPAIVGKGLMKKLPWKQRTDTTQENRTVNAIVNHTKSSLSKIALTIVQTNICADDHENKHKKKYSSDFLRVLPGTRP